MHVKSGGPAPSPSHYFAQQRLFLILHTKKSINIELPPFYGTMLEKLN